MLFNFLVNGSFRNYFASQFNSFDEMPVSLNHQVDQGEGIDKSLSVPSSVASTPEVKIQKQEVIKQRFKDVPYLFRTLCPKRDSLNPAIGCWIAKEGGIMVVDRMKENEEKTSDKKIAIIIAGLVDPTDGGDCLKCETFLKGIHDVRGMRIGYAIESAISPESGEPPVCGNGVIFNISPKSDTLRGFYKISKLYTSPKEDELILKYAFLGFNFTIQTDTWRRAELNEDALIFRSDRESEIQKELEKKGGIA